MQANVRMATLATNLFKKEENPLEDLSATILMIVEIKVIKVSIAISGQIFCQEIAPQ
jgi:hypothetical protein